MMFFKPPTGLLRLACAFSLCLVVSCTSREGGTSGMGDLTYSAEPYPVRIVDRRKFAAQYLPAIVAAPEGYAPGTIVVDTQARQLYLIEDNGKARRYGIAVGASGHSWSGTATVARTAKWPAWYPTDDMRSEVSQLPRRIDPGPSNPLGARALYLYNDGVDTLYRIPGPLNLGPSVLRLLPDASVWSTRTSSTSMAGFPSARRL
jgi:hypothetical protein